MIIKVENKFEDSIMSRINFLRINKLFFPKKNEKNLIS